MHASILPAAVKAVHYWAPQISCMGRMAAALHGWVLGMRQVMEPAELLETMTLMCVRCALKLTEQLGTCKMNDDGSITPIPKDNNKQLARSSSAPFFRPAQNGATPAIHNGRYVAFCKAACSRRIMQILRNLVNTMCLHHIFWRLVWFGTIQQRTCVSSTLPISHFLSKSSAARYWHYTDRCVILSAPLFGFYWQCSFFMECGLRPDLGDHFSKFSILNLLWSFLAIARRVMSEHILKPDKFSKSCGDFWASWKVHGGYVTLVRPETASSFTACDIGFVMLLFCYSHWWLNILGEAKIALGEMFFVWMWLTTAGRWHPDWHSHLPV